MKKLTPTSAFLGVAIGDALGVPFEFMTRLSMKNARIEQMCGFGTHNQPRGTWSDDTSLTLCLAESLLNGYDLANMAQHFIKWSFELHWTARGEVFDIGFTTGSSLCEVRDLLANNKHEDLAYLKYSGQEIDNGNGSLMRILPLLWYIKGKPIAEQFELIWDCSALTHKHIQAGMSCLIYLKLAEYLLAGENKHTAYGRMRVDITDFWQHMSFVENEQAHFSRLIQHDIRDVAIADIKTRGYVIESLESSIWFLLNADNYKDTVLGIINLGHDTDTSGAIAGGLAGLYYGLDDVPSHWLEQLARKDDIIELSKKFAEVYT